LNKGIKEISKTHFRYGYRRVYYFLRPGGWVVNMRMVYRLSRELALQLRNKMHKRKAKGRLSEGRAPAVRLNDAWALDLFHDHLATGLKLRFLTVVDKFARLLPVNNPRFNYRSEEVVTTLDRACREIGYPNTIRVDNVLCWEDLAA
jgi:putative transposase